MHKINILKAVYFLYTQVPEEQFDMKLYRTFYKDKIEDNTNPICNTVGCAAGWLTAIVPESKIFRFDDKTIDYKDTMESILDITCPETWFLFSGEWIDHDNTLQGACKRFLYLLITKNPDLGIKRDHPYREINIISTYNELKSKYEKTT